MAKFDDPIQARPFSMARSCQAPIAQSHSFHPTPFLSLRRPSACTCSCETAVVSLRWWNSGQAHIWRYGRWLRLVMHCCFLGCGVRARESEAGCRRAMQRTGRYWSADEWVGGWLAGWAPPPPARTPLGLNRLRVRRSWMNGSAALLSTSPTWGAAPVRRWPPNIQPTPTPAALSSWPFKPVNIYPRASRHYGVPLPSPTLRKTNFIAIPTVPGQAGLLNRQLHLGRIMDDFNIFVGYPKIKCKSKHNIFPVLLVPVV